MPNLNQTFKCVLLIIVLLMTGCTTATPAATPTPTPPPTATPIPAAVVRLANGEWPPFMGEYLPHDGYFSHLTTEAFAAEGLTVVYDFYPWARALRTVETGESEGSPGWVKTPAREETVRFAGPIGEMCAVFFHRVDYAFDWETETDLVGHRIGTMLGYESTERLESLHRGGLDLTLDSAPDEATNFKKLLLNRIDIFPAAQEVGLYVLRTQFTPEEQAAITYNPTTWGCLDYYVIISPQSPRAEELLQAFNSGIQKLKDSGRYEELWQDFLNGVYDTPAE